MIFQWILKILLFLLMIVLLVFIIICLSSVVTKISFWDGKLNWTVQYLGFQILPFQKKPAFLEKSRKHKKKSDAASNEKKHQDFWMDKFWKVLQNFVNTMDMTGSAVFALPKTLQKLAKAIKWCHIKTDILIGDEDAYDCARQYGMVQAGVQNLLAQIGTLTQVRRKQIIISCDFTQDESRYNISFECRVHVGKSIIAVIFFLWEYLRDSRKAGAEISSKKL